MNDDDVDPIEMDDSHAFDESASEALLAGGGRAAFPDVADLLDDLRVAYASVPPTVGPELAALMGTAVAAAQPRAPRRFERLRSSMLARVGAAAAVVAAATGGLAVAQALPAPVQNLMSHLGVGASTHDGSEADATHGAATTTSTTASGESTVATTTTIKDNHGAVVSGVAHDHNDTGCPHGAAVSQVASDGRSRNDGRSASNTNSHDGSCTSTTTTVDNGTPPTTSTTTSPTAGTHGELGGATPTSAPGVSGGDHGASHGSQPDHGKGGS